MKSVIERTGAVALIALVAGVLGMAGAERSGDMMHGREEMRGMGMMSMMQMMQECHARCEAVREAATETLPRLREAQESDDVAELRAGLGEAIDVLEATTTHMEQCMAMMMGHEEEAP